MEDDELDILAEPDGRIVFIYSDTLARLFAGEPMETRRASHVEPHPTKAGWLADMRPSGGPVLGGGGWSRPPQAIAWSLEHEGRDGIASLPPFETRQAALDAERAWLRKFKNL